MVQILKPVTVRLLLQSTHCRTQVVVAAHACLAEVGLAFQVEVHILLYLCYSIQEVVVRLYSLHVVHTLSEVARIHLSSTRKDHLVMVEGRIHVCFLSIREISSMDQNLDVLTLSLE